MSRRERPQIAVDFAPPGRPNRARLYVALVLGMLAIAAAALAVTQLLLR